MLKIGKLRGYDLRMWITSLLIILSGVSIFAQDSAETSPARRIIFTVVEQPPAFPGGASALKQYLEDHLKFPEGADKKYRTKRIFATFIITETGVVDSARVFKPVNDLVDAEVVRVVENMPAWIPGKQNGYAVAVRYNVAINFPDK